jgi:hypothetical protein
VTLDESTVEDAALTWFGDLGYAIAETHRRRKLEKEYNGWKNAQKS